MLGDEDHAIDALECQLAGKRGLELHAVKAHDEPACRLALARVPHRIAEAPLAQHDLRPVARGGAAGGDVNAVAQPGVVA